MKVKEGERVFETMKRILDMAGKYRRYITSGIVISLFHSLFSAMDLLAILYLSYHLCDLLER